MEVIASGLGVLEGPVTCQDGSVVVTSIDQGRLYRIRDGKSEVLAETRGGPNGATEGADGRIYVSQNGGAAPAKSDVLAPAGVQVISPNGSIEHFGLGMVAPNDLCFGPDGFLYVTDPSRIPNRDDGRIWRCNPKTLECQMLLHCDWYPNGIGFDKETDFVYVADSRHCRIVRIPLDDFSEGAVETVITIDHGIPDGFAFDVDANLLVACPNFKTSGDVQVYRDGMLKEVIRLGTSNLYLNLAISEKRDLYICDGSRGEVLRLDWEYPGLPLYPFRM
jgi:gluconolactonase